MNNVERNGQNSKDNLENTKPNLIKFKLKTSFNCNNRNEPSPSKKMKFGGNNFLKNNNTNKKRINIQEQRSKLAAYNKRQELIDFIKRQNTLIVLGETGSGKTTQIPQIICNAKIHNNGKIAVTEPRRVAAITTAMRVAQEYGNGGTVGDVVGYSVMFEDCTSNRTEIKYLTDDILLREAMFDKLLTGYSVIILDEVHERTVHTDVLFGVVKNAQKAREAQNMTSLKIIIMCATMDVDHISKYFNNCQVVYLEERTYPVELFYAVEPHENYSTACVATFFKIHREAPASHDVLIFLATQEEVDTVAHQIRVLARDPEVDGPAVLLCPLYAAQPSPQQMSVFNPAPENTRKVIVSTHIAESSITVRGIKYVIDCGMIKARTYHPATGLEIQKVQRISQEQAWQRMGRVGRESDGCCYRLYTRSEFEMMQKSTTPEIHRTSLCSIALQILTMDVHPLHFDFMDKPSEETMIAALEQLRLLGAIESTDSKQLTLLGKRMVNFPVDPKFTKILLSSQRFGCVTEVLTIIAMLNVESVLLNPPTKRVEARRAREKFRSPHGDHITLLNIFREFSNVSQENKRSWCHEHYINLRNIIQAREVKTQLQEISRIYDIDVSLSCGSQMVQVKKCLLTGLFMNVAEFHKDGQYITLDKRQVVSIHTSSELYNEEHDFVLFTEAVQTSKCYLKTLTAIESEWLYEIAGNYMRTHAVKYVRDSG